MSEDIGWNDEAREAFRRLLNNPDDDQLRWECFRKAFPPNEEEQERIKKVRDILPLLLGRVVYEAGRFELVLDDLLGSMRRVENEALASHKNKDGKVGAFVKRPPGILRDKIDLLVYLLERSERVSELHDANGIIKLSSWAEELKKVYDLRNLVAHGGCSTTRTSSEGFSNFKFKKHPGKSGEEFRSEWVSECDFENAIAFLKYSRLLLTEVFLQDREAGDGEVWNTSAVLNSKTKTTSG